MRLNFTKMQGAGNDFMVLNLIAQSYVLEESTIRQWGNRHTGVGFDQLLVVEPPQNPDRDFRYRIFNTDGSEAEQCGNGAYCFARFIYDQKLSKKTGLKLETMGGNIATYRRPDGMFEIDMGLPTLPVCSIEEASNTPEVALSKLTIGNQEIHFTQISTGNPHAVIFVDNIITAPLQTLGAQLSTHEFFAKGVNVEFCEIVDTGFVRLRVYERGVGETQACGSGACAAVVAGILQKKLKQKVKVSLPGGKLRVSWLGGNTPITLVGQANLVYEGSIQI
ncbi:MAG: diaminopimelate epimerase [Pseudomonadales bacterium]|nr:diaminopimelate epimerase [Pseudomonadales bacterium]